MMEIEFGILVTGNIASMGKKCILPVHLIHCNAAIPRHIVAAQLKSILMNLLPKSIIDTLTFDQIQLALHDPPGPPNSANRRTIDGPISSYSIVKAIRIIL